MHYIVFPNYVNRTFNFGFISQKESRKLFFAMESILLMVIMVGAAGSGKSTLSKKLINELPSNHTGFIVSADNYVIYSPTGILDFRSLKGAHEKCQQEVVRHMEENTNLIIIDNTNLNMEFLLPYLTFARNAGYDIEFKYPKYGILQYEVSDIASTDHDQVEICVQVRSTGDKIIPRDTITKMVSTFKVIRTFLNEMYEDESPAHVEELRGPEYWISKINKRLDRSER